MHTYSIIEQYRCHIVLFMWQLSRSERSQVIKNQVMHQAHRSEFISSRIFTQKCSRIKWYGVELEMWIILSSFLIETSNQRNPICKDRMMHMFKKKKTKVTFFFTSSLYSYQFNS